MTTTTSTDCACTCHAAPRSPVRDHYLTPAQLVDYLDGAVTEPTLRNWRCDGRGPKHITVGRNVRYPLDRVEAWLRDLN